MLNPGNFRTYTLTEEQAALLVECIEDRVEELKDAAGAESIHTRKEINGMLNHAWDLEIIKDIIDNGGVG